jgi:pyrroloquinoline quinone biosynthesis protein D
MSDERPKLAKKARLKWDAHEKKFMLLYPERGLLLNESAGEIVKLCDGTRSISQIVDALENKANRDVVAPGQIERDVNDLLEKLRERRLLE